GVVEVPPEFVARQIEVCISDLGCDAVKTGMLSSAALIEAVAAKVEEQRLRPLVVDPVMVAKSGAPLLRPQAVAALPARLLPLARVVTPNLHEVQRLHLPGRHRQGATLPTPPRRPEADRRRPGPGERRPGEGPGEVPGRVPLRAALPGGSSCSLAGDGF